MTEVHIEHLVTQFNIKAILKEQNMLCSPHLQPVLCRLVNDTLLKGVARARYNRRSTVKAEDL